MTVLSSIKQFSYTDRIKNEFAAKGLIESQEFRYRCIVILLPIGGHLRAYDRLFFHRQNMAWSSAASSDDRVSGNDWLSNLMREDASGWKTLCIAVSEAIGTAILVFVGCTGCIGSLGVQPNLMQISLAFGLGAMIAIQCIGHISGAHINPSITVAALILGRVSLPMTFLYICSQCIGGLIGFGLIRVITPVQLMYTAQGAGESFCMTDVHTDLTTLQGAMAEVLATGLLVFFACGVWDCRNAANTDSTPMRLGFCITVLCLIFIPYTGCSLNPARTLGPAVWNGYWTNHWVFWIGPIGGAIVSSLLYRCLFLCKTTESE